MTTFISRSSWVLTRKSAIIAIPIILCLQFVHIGRIGRIAVEPSGTVIAALKPCADFGSIKDHVMQIFPYQAVGSFLNTATFGVTAWAWSLFDGSSNMGHVKTYDGTPLCLMSGLEWLPLMAGRYAGTTSGLLLWWFYLGYCIFRRREKPARWLKILLSSLIALPFLLVAVLMAYLAR